MIVISTFALFFGPASADSGPSLPISYRDLCIIPSNDIVDINVKEYDTAFISNVECKIDLDVYLGLEASSESSRLQSFPVYFLLPKNAENITVKVNKKQYIYHFVQNADEFINNSLNSPSEYINDYHVLEWIVWLDDWQVYDAIPCLKGYYDYHMPVNINVTYSHRLVEESNKTYTVKYALIPLAYNEINVIIKLPKKTITDTIIYKPKQLKKFHDYKGPYMHLNENNSDYHVPFGDIEVRFSTYNTSQIYVPDNYSTIQSAVNAASYGDTIIVRDGTYIENIKVDKRLTIQSENGQDSTIVRAASNDDNVFNVTADYVEISGLTVVGVYNANAGMYLYSTDYCTIANNNCTNNRNGIGIKSSNSNLIYLNNFINNNYNAYSEESTNSWNSTEKITYTYNGSTYTNYLGNYWDDYEEKYPDAEEIDSTGVWNTPYQIDGDRDKYPWMEPWKNYFA
jgi:parallel beta-helix repeat protein